MSTLSAGKESIANLQTLTGQLAKANLPAEAKRAVAALEAELGKLDGMLAPLIAAGTEALREATETMEGVQELTGHVDALVSRLGELSASLPAQYGPVVLEVARTLLALLKHTIRVGTRVSNAAQQGQRTLAKAEVFLDTLQGLAAALHARGIVATIPEGGNS